MYCEPKCLGPQSVVFIATRHKLDSPEFETRWRRVFRHRPERPWVPPNLLYNGYLVIPGGKMAGAWH